MEAMVPAGFILVMLMFGVFLLVPFIIWIKFLIEAVKIPDAEWELAGQNKLLFVLLMVFLGVVGTLVYVVAARGPLRQVAQVN
ncbi:MAG: hypothetical protein JWP74_275 [Marmoricola sp.]|nr:hypothetical protein [Marmoricola sp.]